MTPVEKKVFEIIKDEIGIDLSPEEIDVELVSLYVDSDDWSFIFYPEIEKEFKVDTSGRSPIKEWREAGTIRKIAQVIEKYMPNEVRENFMNEKFKIPDFRDGTIFPNHHS